MKKLILLIACGFIPILLSSCASIVSRGNQTVSISTEPCDADITIKNSKGRMVHKSKSPAIVSLPKTDGTYFGGETYQVTVEKDGYTSKALVIDSSASGWYIFGNLGFGGLIGWFIVDPNTGAMYKLEPNEINEILSKEEV